MFEAVGVGIILILKLFPQTPAARLLHTYLVERPAAWLASRTRAHVIFALFIIVLAFAGREFVLVAGTADIAMVLAWDVSLFVDALIVTWTAATVARIKGWRQMLIARWQAVRLPKRPSRAARRRRSRPERPANDDEPAPGRLAA